MNTLYEDDDLLVVAKPAGMVVHPTYRNKTGTLLDALTSAAAPRPSLVGRLDKWTSGIVVAAKSTAVHAALQRTFASPETEKIYLAVVIGSVQDPHGVIECRLKIDSDDRRRVIVAADGAPALTRFDHLATLEDPAGALSLLQCRPMTGRRHQIRVHLAASGWPLLGDAVYGAGQGVEFADPAVRALAGRLPGQALHSWRLTFRHPSRGSRISVEAPITGNMAALLTLFARLRPGAGSGSHA